MSSDWSRSIVCAYLQTLAYRRIMATIDCPRSEGLIQLMTETILGPRFSP